MQVLKITSKDFTFLVILISPNGKVMERLPGTLKDSFKLLLETGAVMTYGHPISTGMKENHCVINNNYFENLK